MSNEIEIKQLKQTKKKRLEFIDSRLFWEGRISRKDLTEYFHISVPQATNDIKFYSELYPKNISYIKSLKEHRATEQFVPKLIIPTSDDYRKQLLVHSVNVEEVFYYGKYPTFYNFHNINRPVEADILKKIIKAINNKQSINITYHSMDNGELNRWISPQALVYDGYRLHVRAYCYRRIAFRDFNLGRIVSIGSHAFESIVDFSYDYLWETFFEAIIKPHPELLDHQKLCIEKEYKMKNSQRAIPIRAASLYYFYRKYGFDITDYQSSDTISAKKQQIVLINKDEIDLKRELLEQLSIAKLKEINYSVPFDK